MQLNEKERTLIKDMKDQENLCADKYDRAAQGADDPQLKALFGRLAQNERTHYDTLCQIEAGNVPAPAGGGAALPTFAATYTAQTQSPQKQNDCYWCSDALATEKHASHLYDTGIFEFRDENVRCLLNHIQKEEQEHGKMIYDYMATNGLYA